MLAQTMGQSKATELAVAHTASACATCGKAKAAREAAAPRGPAATEIINPWTLEFADAALEARYITDKFVTTYVPIVMFYGAYVLANLLLAEVYPDLLFPFVAMLMGALVVVVARIWVHRLVDQQRARTLFGRALLVSFSLATNTSVCWMRMHPPKLSQPFAIVAVGIYTMLGQIYIHHIAVHTWHCIGFLLFVVITTALASPPMTELGHALEATCVILFGSVGSLIGYTIQNATRKAFLDNESHRHELAEANERAQLAVAEACATEERVQHEIAGYVFHELRNNINAMQGILEGIAEDLAAGRATLPVGTAVDLADGCNHAHHAVQVCGRATFVQASVLSLSL